MVIGITLFSNSFIEISSDVAAFIGMSMNGGAPNDNCNARAPIILAFSNLVSVGGPINILPSELSSTASCCTSKSIILRSLIVSHALSNSSCCFSVNSSFPSLILQNYQLLFPLLHER